MTHQLHTIKSQDDCSEFLGWLQEHPEITNVQGWGLDRHEENNRVSAFTYGPNYSDRHWAVCDWMYSERKVFNDWIRTVIDQNPCATCKCFGICLLEIKATRICQYREVA